MIMADDVGIWNISAYHRGMMGGSTPNIDRIAKEGALFTDYYAQQSCTAGRAAFITGQTPFRTGLLKVGMPAAKQGLQDKDPTIAELLKPYGYATAQIGKNHLGDRNEYLPTVHGFDEFYGILYHLNAMEEPYEPDYPKAPQFLASFGPRNIVDTKATTVDDPTTDPRWGKVGKQTIVDGGPLPPHPNMDPKAKFNMEDVDDELVRRSVDFMDRSVKANKPFFLWHNSTRTHVWTHLSPKWQDKSGYGLYADAMMELDAEVGSILKKIDDLGIADNTIVVFTSDNGAETFSWPDGGNSPVPRRKGHHLRGRLPRAHGGEVARHHQARPHRQRHHRGRGLPADVPGRCRRPDVKGKLLNGLKVGDKTFKTHLDGYNFLPFLKGDVAEGPRKEFFYFTDNGDLTALQIRRLEAQLQDHQGQSVYRYAGIHQRSSRDQPAAGSVGALSGRVDDVCPLVGRQALDDGPRRQHRGSVSADLQGISAEPGGRIAEHREGPANGPEWRQRRRQVNGVVFLVPSCGTGSVDFNDSGRNQSTR